MWWGPRAFANIVAGSKKNGLRMGSGLKNIDHK